MELADGLGSSGVLKYEPADSEPWSSAGARILKEYEMWPSAKSDVSGKAEKALFESGSRSGQPFGALDRREEGKGPYMLAFSPFAHGRPTILRSTTGPLSKSKLQTTISSSHRFIFDATSGSTNWLCFRNDWRRVSEGPGRLSLSVGSGKEEDDSRFKDALRGLVGVRGHSSSWLSVPEALLLDRRPRGSVRDLVTVFVDVAEGLR